MPAKQAVDEWVTPQELAAELKVPLDSIYVWNSKGTGPAYSRFGRHVRYTRRDIRTWLTGRYAATDPRGLHG